MRRAFAAAAVVAVGVFGGAGQAAAGDKHDHKNKKVTICHVPPGNPKNAHTITVGESAVKAHLAHGDHKGACKK